MNVFVLATNIKNFIKAASIYVTIEKLKNLRIIVG
jgi:hypothetical protein